MRQGITVKSFADIREVIEVVVETAAVSVPLSQEGEPKGVTELDDGGILPGGELLTSVPTTRRKNTIHASTLAQKPGNAAAANRATEAVGEGAPLARTPDQVFAASSTF
jgi:hypothetical protein